MSSFQAKDDRVQSVQLKVQELCLTSKDSIVADDGGDLLISIGEAVQEVRMAVKVAADGTVTGVAQAGISIESSAPPTDPDDKKVIRLASVALAPGDALLLKHVVAE